MLPLHFREAGWEKPLVHLCRILPVTVITAEPTQPLKGEKNPRLLPSHPFLLSFFSFSKTCGELVTFCKGRGPGGLQGRKVPYPHLSWSNVQLPFLKIRPCLQLCCVLQGFFKISSEAVFLKVETFNLGQHSTPLHYLIFSLVVMFCPASSQIREPFLI